MQTQAQQPATLPQKTCSQLFEEIQKKGKWKWQQAQAQDLRKCSLKQVSY